MQPDIYQITPGVQPMPYGGHRNLGKYSIVVPLMFTNDLLTPTI